jgi:lysophospholipase L1-like esterase
MRYFSKYLFVLLIAFVPLACNNSNPPPQVAPARIAPGAPIVIGQEPEAPKGTSRFLALGDSYTIGEGVQPAERWPNQLVEALRKKGIEIADPTIIARTGWTTDELSAAMDKTKLKERYNLVSLLIGVNNQYRHREVEEYRGQFVALLKRAIELAGGNPKDVFVVSIPDWGVTPMGRNRNPAEIAKEIDRFNAVNKEETLRLNAKYVDITESSRLAANDPTLIVRDGLHPSAKMYSQWVEAALPVAIEALKESKPESGKSAKQ